MARARRVSVRSITPFLWFHDEAEEAAKFYVSVFQGSRIVEVFHYNEHRKGHGPKVLTVAFELAGQPFLALNGGPEFEFTPAVSLFVSCATQREVDTLWERLSEGGKKGRCGWLEDKYGLSWQVVPSQLRELTNDREPERARRVMAALMKMSKLDLVGLERAYRGS
jgi:predicted 3-demethylubiquinone-9 3-methyltransferase (glyoxalase superfamily)